jgi:hypothetical protein
VRIDLDGLVTCGGGCGAPPLGRCEHHEVEHGLGHQVDPRRPDDLAVAYALRLEAEYRDDEGVDYEDQIHKAAEAKLITPERERQLIALENANRDREIESAASELMTVCYGRSPIGSAPRRRWREDLDPDETEERRRLEDARVNGGLTSEDRERYEQLTVPLPDEPIDWSKLPPGLLIDALALVDSRRRRARGESDRRVPGTRRRFPSFAGQPFSRQIGIIYQSNDPVVLVRAVRDLRRNAKRLGMHAPDYDRRRKLDA